MNPTAKKTLKIISDILVILVLLLTFLLHGFRLFGLTPYTVLSGSMQSVYPTGSLIYIAKVEPSELEVGEVITFKTPSGAVATHRIIELVADTDDPSIVYFRTKGDKNDIADGTLVKFEKVIGKPAFCIPLLGYVASYISAPHGKFVAITVALVIIVIEIIASVILDERSGSGDRKETDEQNNTQKSQTNTNT